MLKRVVQSRIQTRLNSKPHVACRPDCQYGRVPSPGQPIPIHVNTVDIPDGIPSDGELRAVVRGLRKGHAGTSGLQAEHIKMWLTDVVCKDEEQSDVGLGEKW